MNSVSVIARKRGKMRNEMGSIARTRSASSCSVTTMVPSSAVLFAPTRPLIMSAVRSGAISRSVPKPRPPAEQALCVVPPHDDGGLDDHDGAREKCGHDDDGQGFDRHLVEIFPELLPVEPPANET